MKKVLFTAVVLMVFGAASAWAGGDAAAGEAVYENVCGDCHFEDDFSGTDEAEILASIKAVAAGEVEHEDLSGAGLTEEDLANVAAYFAAN